MSAGPRSAVMGLYSIAMRYRLAALCLFLFAAAAQAQKFDVVSFKHVGNYRDGGRVEGAMHYGRPWRAPQYTGTRLSGEVPLDVILRFAFSPLVNPYYREAPQWMNEEWHAIDARAPVGTTEDNARAML